MLDTSITSQIGFITAMREHMTSEQLLPGADTEEGRAVLNCFDAVIATLYEVGEQSAVTSGANGMGMVQADEQTTSLLVAVAALLVREGGSLVIPKEEIITMAEAGVYEINALRTDDGLSLNIVYPGSPAMAH